MLTLRPLGSEEHPQSPRGTQLTNTLELNKLVKKANVTHRTAVLAAALEGNRSSHVSS